MSDSPPSSAASGRRSGPFLEYLPLHYVWPLADKLFSQMVRLMHAVQVSARMCSILSSPRCSSWEKNLTLYKKKLEILFKTSWHVQLWLLVPFRILKRHITKWKYLTSNRRGGAPPRPPADVQTKWRRCLRISRHCTCKSICTRCDLLSLAVRQFGFQGESPHLCYTVAHGKD